MAASVTGRRYTEEDRLGRPYPWEAEVQARFPVLAGEIYPSHADSVVRILGRARP